VTISLGNLLIVTLIAVGAPLLANVLPVVKVPSVVLEIVAGIAAGPAGLKWVKVDQAITVLALIGLAFLLFLAGLEIDLMALRGDLLRLPLMGFVVTLAIGLSAGGLLKAVGWIDKPAFLAVALAATSLGLVVPVLKDIGQAEKPLGQYTIAGATIADFGAVILLALLFSMSEGGTTSRLVSLGLFAVVVVAIAFALRRVGRSMRIDALFTRLQDTTAQIRVRVAVALLIAFAALASHAGLEVILGAFIAGAVLGLVDRDSMTHPNFRHKLDAIGYGFVIPVFFVTSGLRFDLKALTDRPSALARVPVLLLALLVARGVPALLYHRHLVGGDTIASALLQATSLPFIVTAASIGVSIGAIDSVTAAALIAAGLVSVVLFPAIATALIRATSRVDSDSVVAPVPTTTTTKG
jgi:Kef-type K+ transport system membrane component KefB